MRLKVTTSILAFGSLLSACDAANDNFTEQEWAQIQKLEPLKGAPPRSPYNHRDQDEDVAKLGQMLFFDKEVAEAITVAEVPQTPVPCSTSESKRPAHSAHSFQWRLTS